MKCKLCETENKLTKAHIIPKWAHKALKEQGFIYTRKPSLGHKKKSPMGIYDLNLVCQKCENAFAHYDDYAKRFFMNRFEKIRKDPPELEGDFIVVENKDYDYKMIKLFILSLLWKASATTQSFYEKVNVGKHNDKLKRMILAANPGTSLEYPVYLLKYREEIAIKQYLQPTMFKDNKGRKHYTFSFGGFIAIIMIDSRSLPEEFECIAISPNQPLIIKQVSLFEDHRMINFMKSHIKLT